MADASTVALVMGKELRDTRRSRWFLLLAVAFAGLALALSLAGKIKPASGKGAIVDWVAYQGTPPKPKAINFGAEKICGDLHRDKAASYETLVVNPNDTVKNTLVTIRGKVAGEYKPPAQQAVVDQVGCIFTPHVVGVMVGQDLEFRNSDPVTHNIRGTPTRNQAFNNVFASKVSPRTRFDSPEIGIPLKCDIHFWMSGFVHVSPHPFFAVTGDDGSFIIPDVPRGITPCSPGTRPSRPRPSPSLSRRAR